MLLNWGYHWRYDNEGTPRKIGVWFFREPHNPRIYLPLKGESKGDVDLTHEDQTPCGECKKRNCRSKNGLACLDCDSNFLKANGWEFATKENFSVSIKEFTIDGDKKAAVEVLTSNAVMFYRPGTRKIINLDEYKEGRLGERFFEDFDPPHEEGFVCLDALEGLLDPAHNRFSAEQIQEIFTAIKWHQDMEKLTEIEIASDAIYLRDIYGEIVSWIEDEWADNPAIVVSIANAIKTMYEKGPAFVRRMLQAQKKTYQIPIVCQQWGIMQIKASSLTEAENIALTSAPLPYEMEYIDGSLQLDRESSFYGKPIVEREG